MNFITKSLSKIFGGNKYEKDIKLLDPIVQSINDHFNSYASLTHDELRHKTVEFRERIAAHLSSIDQQIEALTASATALDAGQVDEKDDLFNQVDELTKDRDKELEVILEKILPEAFAVVKETARRFSENNRIAVKATQLDRDLSVSKDFIVIEGDQAVYANEWTAAGADIKWNMVHYDVQLIGGIVLHQGKIAEMATGEGKTLVATLPAYLNALASNGVHIVTVNNYLALRDSEWNAPLFNFLGITIDCIDKYPPHSPERRAAYLNDITYGTNNEFGFDYLRDNMVRTSAEKVQRKHHYAMIDEVDSVLVDDARTPLIISGPVPKGDIQEYGNLKPRIVKLVEAQRRLANVYLTDAKRLYSEGKTKEAGIPLLKAHRALPKNSALIKFLSEQGVRQQLLETEGTYMAENNKRMPEIDNDLLFVIDEKSNSVDLTDKGIDLITDSGEDSGFFVIPDVGALIADIEKKDTSKEEKVAEKDVIMQDFAIKSERIHSVQQLLKAYALFEKDVEYVVMDGKVKIVDEQTGRIMEGRRYSDGLHQAIEAKENVKVEAATQTYATITLQNFFRMYHKLAGMTGTAETEAGELWEIYKLDVTVIPTNRPIVRNDMEDMIYKTRKDKLDRKSVV